jgi:CheY-like chemotaxis protein
MSKRRVLIVEDEAIAARAAQYMLQSAGCEVAGIVDTGEAAVARAEEERPDMVLMDIRLKGSLDGIEAGRRIHASLNIPILFVTAYSGTELADVDDLPDTCYYLSKPIDENRLKALLQRAIGDA